MAVAMGDAGVASGVSVDASVVEAGALGASAMNARARATCVAVASVQGISTPRHRHIEPSRQG